MCIHYDIVQCCAIDIQYNIVLCIIYSGIIQCYVCLIIIMHIVVCNIDNNSVE